MRVNGQLEVAQLENLSGAAATPTNLPLGRIWVDITAPTLALAKFWDGTAIRTFAYTGTTSISDRGATGQVKVINWNNGTNQRTRITSAYAIIQFAGAPVDGTLYTLIVDTVALQGKIYFDVDHESLGKPKIFTKYNQGETRVYTFMYQSTPNASQTTGFYFNTGGAYANGSTTGRSIDVGYPIDGKRRVYVTTTGATNQSNMYYIETTAGAAHASYNYAKTVVSGNDCTCVRIHPTANVELYSGYNTPFIAAQQTQLDAGLAGAFANPGTLPTGSGLSCDWHPSGRDCLITHQTAPYITTYPFLGSAFGTKYSNPVSAVTVTTNPYQGSFAPSGDFIAILTDLSPFLQVYEWSQGVGFGNRITDPVGGAAPPTGAFFSHRMAWRPQVDWIVYGLNASPWIYQVPFARSVSGTFGTAVTPSLTGTPPTTAVNAVGFSPCGQWLAVGLTSVLEPLRIYPFNSVTGVDFANPLTVSSGITDDVRDLVWDRDGSRIYYMCGTNSPRVFQMPHRARNWIRVNDY